MSAAAAAAKRARQRHSTRHLLRNQATTHCGRTPQPGWTTSNGPACTPCQQAAASEADILRRLTEAQLEAYLQFLGGAT